MTWRDVNSCYCDWWVPSGISDRWWWCDVKMVERRCWRTREIECTLPCAIVTTYVVCDKRWYSYGMSLRYFRFFLAVVRFLYEMTCLLVLVPIAVVSQYSGVMGWWRGGDAKACMREWVREEWGGGDDGEYMLRRGESSWLCIKFEVVFFAGHSIFDQGSSAFFSCVACEWILPPFLA